jgi:hypothetical protein
MEKAALLPRGRPRGQGWRGCCCGPDPNGGRRLVYLEAGRRQRAGADENPYDRARFSPVVENIPAGASKIFVVIPCLGFREEPGFSARFIDKASGASFEARIDILSRNRNADLETRLGEATLIGIPPGAYFLYIYAKVNDPKAGAYSFTSCVIPRSDH